MLIGHGSDYFLDEGEGRPGLLHNRKRAGLPPGERLGDLARRTLHAAALLETRSGAGRQGPLRDQRAALPRQRPARAPNSDATLAALRPELETLCKTLFAAPFELARVGGAKELFAVRITSGDQRAAGDAPRRAGGPPAADASLVA